MFFAAPDDPGPSGRLLHRAARTLNLPLATPGMLALTPDEIEAIERRRVERLRRRRIAYLRRVAPKETQGMDDASVYAFIVDAETSGARLGIEGHRAHCRWAFLQAKAGNRPTPPQIERYIRQEGRSPDDQVRSLVRGVAERLASGGAGAHG